jgi:UDP-N-acetyl-D-glucosamine dehydrogenase
VYSLVVEENKVVPVGSLKVAEMTKLLENTFRSVNIALINELTFLSDRMDINIWEVIEAAASKPFGYMPFYPGPGVGGHCIPVDPYYLSWKAREFDFYTKFIELSAETNQMMPNFVMTKLTRVLNHQGKALKGAKILAMGVTFKKNVNDARNSPPIRVIKLMQEAGANVSYVDPFVPVLDAANGVDEEELVKPIKRSALTAKNVKAADCVVVLVDHDAFDYAMVLKEARAILDTRNIMARYPGSKKKVERL